MYQKCIKKIRFHYLNFEYLILFIRWIGLRLEFLGSLIVLAASIFAIIAKQSISSGIAGLSISSATSVILYYLLVNLFN